MATYVNDFSRWFRGAPWLGLPATAMRRWLRGAPLLRYLAGTSPIPGDFRLRELPARFQLAEQPARFAMRELGPRFKLTEKRP
jgi:hypothetical protein